MSTSRKIQPLTRESNDKRSQDSYLTLLFNIAIYFYLSVSGDQFLRWVTFYSIIIGLIFFEWFRHSFDKLLAQSDYIEYFAAHPTEFVIHKECKGEGCKYCFDIGLIHRSYQQEETVVKADKGAE